MPGKTLRLYNQFYKQINYIEQTRSKCEDLFSKKLLSKDNISLLYGGLFLEVFTDFESLIEKLFLGLVSGELYSPNLVIKRKVKIVPKSFSRDVIFGGKKYLDWLPYDSTKKRASLYFDSPEPFNLLSNQDIQQLEIYHKIRNALAHKSDKALNDFLTIIPNNLLQNERSPSGYLRSQPYGASSQTQFEIAIIELDAIAKKLCN